MGADLSNWRERRKAVEICSCGHHSDSHFDNWAGCDECECGEYVGPKCEMTPEERAYAEQRFLGMIKKDHTFHG